MKKIINVVLKVLLSLVFIMPVLGIIGIFPEPTREMYNTDQAFNFIQVVLDAKHINIMMSVVFLLSLFFVWTRRTALAMLLILPITLNIVGFHLVLDGGLFTGGAVMGNIFFLINLYFLWQNKDRYSSLFSKEV